MITAKQAAHRLGLSVQRVRAMIAAGKLKADKVGRDWVIQESSLDNVKVYGRPGRPKQEKGK